MPRYAFDIVPAVHVNRPHDGSFSYASKHSLPIGTLVSVPLGRRKAVFGIVVGKGSQKTMRLKPIHAAVTEKPFFPRRAWDFLQWEAEATVTPLGDVFQRALPSWLNLRNRAEELSGALLPSGPAAKRGVQAKLAFITGNSTSRNAAYKKHIAAAKKTKRQLLILSPSARGRIALAKSLPGTVQAPLGRNRDAQQLWLRIRSGEPLAIVGTKSALRLPFTDLHTIILDEEGDELYKETRERPYTDARIAARRLGALHGAQVIAGAVLPSLATLGSVPKKDRPRLPHMGSVEITDLNAQKPTQGFAHPLYDALLRFSKRKSKARGLLYINRRGDALTLSCADCGFTFNCQKCDAPMPVYQAHRLEKDAKRGLRLRCRHCGEIFIPPMACPSCRGLTFIPLGFAGAGMGETLKSFFPKLGLYRLDSDTAPTPKEQQRILKAFAAEKGPALLIATRMALTKPLPKLDLAAVPAFDHVNAIPDFRADEEALQTLLSISNLLNARGKLFIQSWHPERPVLRAAQGTLAVFAEEELAMRKRFGWPPYRRVARLLFAHSDGARALKEAGALAQLLTEKFAALPSTLKLQIIGPVPAFIPRIRNKVRQVILLKWAPSNAMDMRVETLLQQHVPAAWSVDIDPDRIL